MLGLIPWILGLLTGIGLLFALAIAALVALDEALVPCAVWIELRLADRPGRGPRLLRAALVPVWALHVLTAIPKGLGFFGGPSNDPLRRALLRRALLRRALLRRGIAV